MKVRSWVCLTPKQLFYTFIIDTTDTSLPKLGGAVNLTAGVNLNQQDRKILGPVLDHPNQMTLEEYQELISNQENNKIRYLVDQNSQFHPSQNKEMLLEVMEENEDNTLFNQSSIQKPGYKVPIA